MPTDAISTVIGFDYGERWIGVAVGQTLTRRASPLPAIRAGDWDAIERVLDEWKPGRLIVGLPLNMRDERQAITVKAERFSRQLEGRFGIDVAWVDERLTTREAYQLALDGLQKKSKPEIDSLSAMLITESWLNDGAVTALPDTTG